MANSNQYLKGFKVIALMPHLSPSDRSVAAALLNAMEASEYGYAAPTRRQLGAVTGLAVETITRVTGRLTRSFALFKREEVGRGDRTLVYRPNWSCIEARLRELPVMDGRAASEYGHAAPTRRQIGADAGLAGGADIVAGGADIVAGGADIVAGGADIVAGGKNPFSGASFPWLRQLPVIDGRAAQ